MSMHAEVYVCKDCVGMRACVGEHMSVVNYIIRLLL